MKEISNVENAVKNAVKSTKHQHPTWAIKRQSIETSCRPQAQNDVSVTIDIAGRITDCSPEAKILLGHRTNQLSGVALTEVIPTLPFCPNTPYYNLAFAVFNTGNATPMQRMAMTADGKNVPINIALSRTIIRGRHLIKVHLSAPKNQANKLIC